MVGMNEMIGFAISWKENQDHTYIIMLNQKKKIHGRVHLVPKHIMVLSHCSFTCVMRMDITTPIYTKVNRVF